LLRRNEAYLGLFQLFSLGDGLFLVFFAFALIGSERQLLGLALFLTLTLFFLVLRAVPKDCPTGNDQPNYRNAAYEPAILTFYQHSKRTLKTSSIIYSIAFEGNTERGPTVDRRILQL
jgi:hypothetical protein